MAAATVGALTACYARKRPPARRGVTPSRAPRVQPWCVTALRAQAHVMPAVLVRAEVADRQDGGTAVRRGDAHVPPEIPPTVPPTCERQPDRGRRKLVRSTVSQPVAALRPDQATRTTEWGKPQCFASQGSVKHTVMVEGRSRQGVGRANTLGSASTQTH